jgi:nitroreductase
MEQVLKNIVDDRKQVETRIAPSMIVMLDSILKYDREDTMNVTEAIKTRRSIRAFKPDSVPNKVLQELLDIGRWAPSGGNVQPWYFEVLAGEPLAKVKARLEEKAKTWDGHEYVNTNPDMPRTGPYSKLLMPRWKSFKTLTDAIRYPPGTKDMEAKQLEYRKKTLRFFDAPSAIIVCSDDRGSSAIVSIGAVTQTICLAALTYGLGTCIMGIPVLWPDIFREVLNIAKDRAIITSIAIGYPDLDAPLNQFPRPREPLANLVEWHGF